MSVNVDLRVAEAGSDEYVEQAWALKERIRQLDGVLKQREGFFTDAYRRSTVRLLFDGDDIAGFAATRSDGYILFLAVAPEYRGEGLGERLVAEVAEAHSSVTCHARTTNENAVEFYRHLGFEIDRHIENYYEDNGDAYYLTLGDREGIASKLSDLIRR